MKRLIQNLTLSSPNDSYYDLFEDWNLIESSFAQQYGIRLRLEDEMTWDEFSSLLSGIGADTPLGRVVSIRSEKDQKVISEWSPEVRKIRTDWASRKIKKKVVVDRQKYNKEMINLQNMFKSISTIKRKEGGNDKQ